MPVLPAPVRPLDSGAPVVPAVLGPMMLPVPMLDGAGEAGRSSRFRQESRSTPVRPSQLAPEVPVGPVPEPVLIAGGVTIPGGEGWLVFELCAHAAPANAHRAALIAMLVSFVIVRS